MNSFITTGLAAALALGMISSAPAKQLGSRSGIHRHRIVNQVSPRWFGAGMPSEPLGGGGAPFTINGYPASEWEKFAPTPNAGG